ncbi:MAG: hypothetical protein QW220_05220 [Candidatus Bathyarchaeia archaeon]
MGLEEQKERLIQAYIRQGILQTPSVIEAFRRTPREEFLPRDLRPYAYNDTPLPVGWGQTISAPLSSALGTG